MSNAIQTRYIFPTTDQPLLQITVFDCEDRTITIPFPNAKTTEDSHKLAVLSFMESFDITGKIYGGWINEGMSFVIIPD
jgi:hypothetical protein